jgi:hypothetical protein
MDKGGIDQIVQGAFGLLLALCGPRYRKLSLNAESTWQEESF